MQRPSLSLCLALDSSCWVSSESNWLFNKKFSMVTWMRLKQVDGRVRLSQLDCDFLFPQLSHTWIPLSLSLSHSHTLESFSYICEMKNRFQLPRNLQLRNADGRTKDSYKCSYSCRYRYTDTDTDTPLVIVVEKDTTAIADKYLLWSLRHLRKLLSVFILSAIYFYDFFLPLFHCNRNTRSRRRQWRRRGESDRIATTK